MDLTAPARDIEELVDAFNEIEGTELAQMKDLWRDRSFSFIHEARPKDVIPSFYAQGLFSSALTHIVEGASSFRRLGGLYMLYILHGTQPQEASYRIYLSLEELEAINSLVKELNSMHLAVPLKVLRTMFSDNMFLFGSVSANQKRIARSAAKLALQARARVQQARVRVLTEEPVRQHFQSLLKQDLGLDELTHLTQEYAVAKQRALSDGKLGEGAAGNGNAARTEVTVGVELEHDVDALDSRKAELLILMEGEDIRSKAVVRVTRHADPESRQKRQKTISEYERELREQEEESDLEQELVEELHRVLDNE